jgi:hypothetical protein
MPLRMTNYYIRLKRKFPHHKLVHLLQPAQQQTVEISVQKGFHELSAKLLRITSCLAPDLLVHNDN